jgi:hypothetical protein
MMAGSRLSGLVGFLLLTAKGWRRAEMRSIINEEENRRKTKMVNT